MESLTEKERAQNCLTEAKKFIDSAIVFVGYAMELDPDVEHVAAEDIMSGLRAKSGAIEILQKELESADAMSSVTR